MKIKNILISQQAPLNGSPYTDLISKYKINIDFYPFFRVEPITGREFRTQKINILDYTAVVFTAKSTIDAFFKICEDLRLTVPDTMKYFCLSEAVAPYLQKHIIYRKRKIFYGKGTIDSIIDSIGTKHKNEKFLIATTDSCKPEIFKTFSKAKLKYSNAVFSKTVHSDLNEVDVKKYQMLVFYSPTDVASLIGNFPDFKQDDLLFATFGPTTAKAMKTAKLKTEIVTPTPETPSIAKAIQLYLEKNK